VKILTDAIFIPYLCHELMLSEKPDMQCIVCMCDGDLIAGVVYENYEKNARISLHCAGIGKRWLSKQFLWMVFDYPFNQLNVNVIVNTVSSDNKDSIKFTEHCGFKEQTRIIGGASDGDLIIYTLYKKDCKWIGLKHEK